MCLHRLPGSRVLNLAKFFYPRKKFERIFLQSVTDMREEYFAALASGEIWHARWIYIRGIWSVLAAAFADLPLSLVKLFVKLWKAAN